MSELFAIFSISSVVTQLQTHLYTALYQTIDNLGKANEALGLYSLYHIFVKT